MVIHERIVDADNLRRIIVENSAGIADYWCSRNSGEIGGTGIPWINDIVDRTVPATALTHDSISSGIVWQNDQILELKPVDAGRRWIVDTVVTEIHRYDQTA